MLKVLYCNENLIIDSLAESLVIGGLPMYDKVPTKEGLEDEIQSLKWKLKVIWKNKVYFTFNKEVKQIRLNKSILDMDLNYLSNEFGIVGINLEQKMDKINSICESLDVYCKRGRTLGNVSVGSGHNSLFKGVQFNMIINFPLYWLKELQRYHFTDIISSQSTMHKVLKFNLNDMFSDEVDPRCIAVIEDLKEKYNMESDKDKKKQIWRRIINSLPDGFSMAMGITMNYLQLTTMIPQREKHKLSEWSEDLIPFFKSLPYYDFFIQ
jgi:hypothetical protein